MENLALKTNTNYSECATLNIFQSNSLDYSRSDYGANIIPVAQFQEDCIETHRREFSTKANLVKKEIVEFTELLTKIKQKMQNKQARIELSSSSRTSKRVDKIVDDLCLTAMNSMPESAEMITH